MRWGDPCIVRHTAEYLRSSKKNGFAGTIEIISSGSRRKICDFTLDPVRTSVTANEAVFSSKVPRYQGIEQWNDPLEGLLVTSAWSQSADGLHLTQTVTLKNLNPRKEPMKVALLVRNYAFIHNGELLAEMPDGLRSFNEASAALLKKDAVLPFSAKTCDHPGWPGGKVFVIAPSNGKRRGYFACIPDPACSGVYSWSDFTGGRTAEFFTPDLLLDWNGEKTFTFQYEVGLAPAGFPEQTCKK